MLKISSFFILFFSLIIFNNAEIFAQQKDTITGNKNVRADFPKNNEDTLLIKSNNKVDTT